MSTTKTPSAAATPKAKRFPDAPAHPERTCWGCDRFCSSKSMLCGNGSVRTPHPAELFGDDWREWGLGAEEPAVPEAPGQLAVIPIVPASGT